MSKFENGDKVSWAWGDGEGAGKIVQIYTSKVTKTISGTEVTRNASEEEPAYLIEQEDGDKVLKSVTEISKS